DLLRPGSRPELGLGGDPFHSALEDTWGWWVAAGLAERPGAGAEARLAEPLSLGPSGRDGRWSETDLAWSTVSEWRLGGRTVRAAGEFSAPRLGASWHGPESGVA